MVETRTALHQLLEATAQLVVREVDGAQRGQLREAVQRSDADVDGREGLQVGELLRQTTDGSRLAVVEDLNLRRT